ncbi:MAG: DUF2786 domain-containing protein [Acetobacteraceae bacterium]|nr:DUF2786 domain-containing protein [Acetobacteraceae bacterium]
MPEAARTVFSELRGRLGAAPSGAGAKDAELDRLIGRIQALRAKTVEQGCTEQEALAAAEKVAELLDRYGLSLSELDLKRQACEGPRSRPSAGARAGGRLRADGRCFLRLPGLGRDERLRHAAPRVLRPARGCRGGALPLRPGRARLRDRDGAVPRWPGLRRGSDPAAPHADQLVPDRPGARHHGQAAQPARGARGRLARLIGPRPGRRQGRRGRGGAGQARAAPAGAQPDRRATGAAGRVRGGTRSRARLRVHARRHAPGALSRGAGLTPLAALRRSSDAAGHPRSSDPTRGGKGRTPEPDCAMLASGASPHATPRCPRSIPLARVSKRGCHGSVGHGGDTGRGRGRPRPRRRATARAGRPPGQSYAAPADGRGSARGRARAAEGLRSCGRADR